jgi:hypothetical protein
MEIVRLDLGGATALQQYRGEELKKHVLVVSGLRTGPPLGLGSIEGACHGPTVRCNNHLVLILAEQY